jgi:hypothetical protein
VGIDIIPAAIHGGGAVFVYSILAAIFGWPFSTSRRYSKRTERIVNLAFAFCGGVAVLAGWFAQSVARR